LIFISGHSMIARRRTARRTQSGSSKWMFWFLKTPTVIAFSLKYLRARCVMHILSLTWYTASVFSRSTLVWILTFSIFLPKLRNEKTISWQVRIRIYNYIFIIVAK